MKSCTSLFVLSNIDTKDVGGMYHFQLHGFVLTLKKILFESNYFFKVKLIIPNK